MDGLVVMITMYKVTMYKATSKARTETQAEWYMLAVIMVSIFLMNKVMDEEIPPITHITRRNDTCSLCPA